MTIDERLEALTMTLELLVHDRADSEAKSEVRRAEYEARQVEHEAKLKEYEAKRAEYEAKRAEHEAMADARQTRTERSLRRWADLGVRETRRHRERVREIEARFTEAHLATEESITRLAAAQLVTEERLAAFIASQGSGRNGGSKL